MPFDPTTFDPAQIPIVQAVFWVMTFCTIGGALGVVSSRNLFHSALYLILSFFGVTGYYVLLSAGFLAVVQLFIYIGAISVLILFAIMFSRRLMGVSQSQANHQWWLALPVVVILLMMLLGVVGSIQWPVSEAEPQGDMVLQLGLAFLGSYLIPFEVVGVLLSVALIGAIILAREKIQAEEVKYMAIPLSWWLMVSATLFCIGVYGALTRRNAIGILMGVELILNAVNINLVAFWRYIAPNDVAGQIFAIIVITVAAAEAAVGLAIVISVYRRRHSVVVEELDILRN